MMRGMEHTPYFSFVKKYTAKVGRITRSISEVSTSMYEPK